GLLGRRELLPFEALGDVDEHVDEGVVVAVLAEDPLLVDPRLALAGFAAEGVAEHVVERLARRLRAAELDDAGDGRTGAVDAADVGGGLLLAVLRRERRQEDGGQDHGAEQLLHDNLSSSTMPNPAGSIKKGGRRAAKRPGPRERPSCYCSGAVLAPDATLSAATTFQTEPGLMSGLNGPYGLDASVMYRLPWSSSPPEVKCSFVWRSCCSAHLPLSP